MVVQILLEWLVSQLEAESSLSIHVDRLLQIEFVEGNHLLDRFRPLFFNHHEVELSVNDPVIGYVENRAVFQK